MKGLFVLYVVSCWGKGESSKEAE